MMFRMPLPFLVRALALAAPALKAVVRVAVIPWVTSSTPPPADVLI